MLRKFSRLVHTRPFPHRFQGSRPLQFVRFCTNDSHNVGEGKGYNLEKMRELRKRINISRRVESEPELVWKTSLTPEEIEEAKKLGYDAVGWTDTVKAAQYLLENEKGSANDAPFLDPYKQAKVATELMFVFGDEIDGIPPSLLLSLTFFFFLYS